MTKSDQVLLCGCDFV